MRSTAKWRRSLNSAATLTRRLAQGVRLMEVLKQPQYSLYHVQEQVAIICVAVNGFLLDIKVENISAFIKNCIEYLNAQNSDLMKSIAESGELSDEQESALKEAIEAFKVSELKNSI